MKFKRYHKRFGAGFLALLLSAFGITQLTDRSVTLTWVAPTERTDGLPLEAGELLGYDLDCDNGRTYSAITETTVTFDVQPGTLTCELVALATGNNGDILRSEPTIGTFLIPTSLTQPKAPTDFNFQIN